MTPNWTHPLNAALIICFTPLSLEPFHIKNIDGNLWKSFLESQHLPLHSCGMFSISKSHWKKWGIPDSRKPGTRYHPRKNWHIPLNMTVSQKERIVSHHFSGSYVCFRGCITRHDSLSMCAYMMRFTAISTRIIDTFIFWSKSYTSPNFHGTV